MKSNKLMKRLMAVFVVLAITAMISVQTFASVWTFDQFGSGSNPFAPRGYSVYATTEKWLESDYDHATEKHGNMWCASFGTADNSLEVSTLSAGSYTMHAWLDKNPTGHVLAGTNDYKNYLAVYITNSSNVTTGPTALTSLDSSYGVSVSDAVRTVTDPNGKTNQWSIPFTMTLKSGESYTFVFLNGFEANNGNTLALYDSSTTDGDPGVIGYVNSTSYTSAEQAIYNSRKGAEYYYFDYDSAYPIGIDGNGYDVYSTSSDFYDFDYSVSVS